jgi:hypothetical protein
LPASAAGARASTSCRTGKRHKRTGSGRMFQETSKKMWSRREHPSPCLRWCLRWSMRWSEDEVGFERGRRRSSRLLAGFGRDLPTTTTTTLASLASSPSYRAPVRLLGERERERERDGHQGSRGGPEATHGRPRRVGPVRPSQLGSRTRQRLQLTTPCTPPLLPGDPGSASLLQNTATPDRPPGCLRLGGDGQGQRSAYGLLPSSSRRSSPPWADLAHLLAFARPPSGQARSMDPLNLDKLLTAMSPSAQGACGSCGRRRHRCARLTRSPVDSVPADIRTEVEGLIREYLERNIE